MKNMLIPTHCPKCKTLLIINGVHLQCINENCDGRQLDKILYWVNKCEMDQVSESTITTLFNEGLVNTISDLYNIKAEQLQNVYGFGQSKITNLIKQIEKSRTMTAESFISKLGISLVGERMLKKLGIDSIEKFLSFNDSTYVAGQNIIEWKANSDNMSLFNELLSIMKIKISKKDTNMKTTVCFTGTGPFGRKELSAKAEEMGYQPVDGVNKELQLLVCEDINGGSSKLVKARKLGIKLMSYEEFFK